MTPTPDPAKLFVALEPERLGELAEQAYVRRREHDLARALASPRGRLAADRATVPTRRRRSRRLAAGLAAAIAMAVAAMVAAMVAVPHAPPVPTGRQTPNASPWAQPLDARGVLLVSAKMAGRTPDVTGRYWYTRVRRADLEIAAEGVPGDSPQPPDGLRVPPPKPGYGRMARLLHIHTEETWAAVRAGDPSRVISNQDAKLGFASPADKASWERIGASELPWPARPEVRDLDGPLTVRILDMHPPLTMDQVRKLPTEAAQLEVALRRLYHQQPLAEINGTLPPFSVYLWDVASALLPAPITPGTRATLYQVLAQHQGQDIRMVGKVSDPLGRQGVAFAWPDPAPDDPDAQGRLIIDPGSGRLLAQVHTRGAGHQLDAWTAYQAMGWTDRIGERAGD
jgi:hypothetical protein